MGVILYEMIHKKKMFEGKTGSVEQEKNILKINYDLKDNLT